MGSTADEVRELAKSVETFGKNQELLTKELKVRLDFDKEQSEWMKKQCENAMSSERTMSSKVMDWGLKIGMVLVAAIVGLKVFNVI